MNKQMAAERSRRDGAEADGRRKPTSPWPKGRSGRHPRSGRQAGGDPAGRGEALALAKVFDAVKHVDAKTMSCSTSTR